MPLYVLWHNHHKDNLGKFRQKTASKIRLIELEGNDQGFLDIYRKNSHVLSNHAALASSQIYSTRSLITAMDYLYCQPADLPIFLFALVSHTLE